MSSDEDWETSDCGDYGCGGSSEEDHKESRRSFVQGINNLMREWFNARDDEIDRPLLDLKNAVIKDNIEEVQRLLDRGADISALAGRSAPIHNARSREMAEFLLTNGADVDVKTFGGRTALHIASLAGRKEVAATLLNHKANIDARDSKRCTPLMLTTSTEMARLLLWNGANVNARDNRGMTALHRTFRKPRIFAPDNIGIVCPVLLEHGADLRSRDNKGADVLKYVLSVGPENSRVVNINLHRLFTYPDLRKMMRANRLSEYDLRVEWSKEYKELRATHPPVAELLLTDYPRYVRNESLMASLEDFVQNNNDYSFLKPMIELKLDGDKYRMQWLLKGQDLLQTILKQAKFSLPDELRMKILCCLENKDLVKFVQNQEVEQTNFVQKLMRIIIAKLVAVISEL